MRAFLIVCVLSLGCATTAHAPQDIPWTPDGCSDPLRLYTEQAYQGCCDVHDWAYEKGGLEPDRLLADQRLYICVYERGFKQDAASMFVAVRTFGESRFRYRKD